MSEQYDFVRKLREKQSVEGSLAENFQGALPIIPLEEEFYENSGQTPGLQERNPVEAPNYCAHCGQSLQGVTEENSPSERRQHSRLGMVLVLKAFVLAFVLVASILIGLILPEDAPDLWYSVVALVWMGIFAAAALGMGLSVFGLLRKNRHRLFPVLGMVCHAMIVGMVILLALFCTACYLLYPEMGSEDEYDFVHAPVSQMMRAV